MKGGVTRLLPDSTQVTLKLFGGWAGADGPSSGSAGQTLTVS